MLPVAARDLIANIVDYALESECMKDIVRKSLVILCALALLAPALAAQHNGSAGNGMVEALRRQMEQTDQLIDRAKEVVQGSNSAKAKLALESAIKLQENAWTKFNLGTVVGYKEASMFSAQARERAKYAIANGPFTEQNDDVVLRKLERANELLDNARESLSGNQDKSLQSTFDTADDNLTRAWEFYRNGQPRPALKLCNQVEKAINRIITMANRRNANQASFQRHLDNIQSMIQQAQDQLSTCTDPNAKGLVEQAQKSFRVAQDLSADGHLAAAVRALLNARNLCSQALGMCTGFDALNQHYDRIKSDADLIKETVPPSGDKARRLLDQVYQQLGLARQYIDDQKTDLATAALKAADLSLNLVVKMLNQDDGTE